ncbi:histidine phosphatase family protein [Candidatus Woesearchaeota archaeon]|nr:histidine phosphatase family protein [Candidatus Woesearchaeota archaeon]
MKKCYIYLFRHGTTWDNARGKFSGFRQTTLNVRGKEDAKIVALRLKNEKIHIAYQSSLKRSKQTLKEVLKFHPECKSIVTDDRIIERDYGNVTGMTHYSYISKNSPKKYDGFHRGYKISPPGGESMFKVEVRVNDFIEEVLKFVKKNKVNVAVSAHGNSMRPFRKYFEKLTVKQMLEIENPYDNIFVYEVKAK